jgi:hypothetical protein
MLCTNCGSQVHPSARLCPHCGGPMYAAAPPRADAESTPPQVHSPYPHLQGLEGWLIVLGLSLLGSLVLIGRTILRVNLPFLLSPGMKTFLGTHRLVAALVASEAIMNAFFLVVLIWLLYLFATQKRSFPSFLIAYYVLHFVLMFCNHVAFRTALPSADLSAGFSAVARAAVPLLVWVPYLLVSKRVKATFVR